MSKILSRRDFLKIAGGGAAATAALTGCGPASRYVVRRPYAEMPEYNQTGLSTYYATTCRECPAGCGIIVRTMEGRAIKVEGNPNHPVSRGKVCSTGLTSVQGLYNPDRVAGPVRMNRGGSGAGETIDWDAAVEVVRGALTSTAPDGIGFLLGLGSDHLYDLVTELASTMGASPPARFGALGMLDGRESLMAASWILFGAPVVPYFDLANADVVFAFGDILNTWVSPVAYTRAYGAMRQGRETRRGYLVAFEPVMSQTGASADEWIPVVPGSEGLVALAIGNMVAGLRNVNSGIFADVDINSISQQSGVAAETLQRLAEMFAGSTHPLAVPGIRRTCPPGRAGGRPCHPEPEHNDRFHRPAGRGLSAALGHLLRDNTGFPPHGRRTHRHGSFHGTHRPHEQRPGEGALHSRGKPGF